MLYYLGFYIELTLIRFSADSVFQASSVSFPLAASITDADNDFRTAAKTIQRSQWKYWKLTDELHHLLVVSTVPTQSTYRNLFFSGIENGVWVKYTFEKINGKWKLIRIEDYST